MSNTPNQEVGMKLRVAAAILSHLTLTLPLFAFQAALKAANPAEAAYLSYVAAWKSKDLTLLDKVIARDYMTLNGQKKVSTKSDEIEEAKTSPAYDTMRVDEIHSLVVGDTAVISALLTVAGISEGKPYTVQVRDLATFLRRNGSWQLVADQSAS
jgi:ketosteroid isomerase-like protein